MSNYYYLAASLPPLEFPKKPDVSVASLRSSLDLNLSKEDAKKVESLRLFVDILNIRPLLQEQEIDLKGNLGERDLNEALLDKVFLPEYVFDFLEDHETLAEKLRDFSSLLAQFFVEEGGKQKGFLHRFFAFEREWRLVILALRAKVLHRDLIKELQFEDSSDPFVMQILSQKDSDEYEPPAEYKEVKEFFEASGSDPVEQNKACAMYRFYKIEEMKEGGQFSIDGILAYLAQLMIIESWNELDKVKGKLVLDTFKTS
jgi:hypothetical protein